MLNHHRNPLYIIRPSEEKKQTLISCTTKFTMHHRYFRNPANWVCQLVVWRNKDTTQSHTSFKTFVCTFSALAVSQNECPMDLKNRGSHRTSCWDFSKTTQICLKPKRVFGLWNCQDRVGEANKKIKKSCWTSTRPLNSMNIWHILCKSANSYIDIHGMLWNDHCIRCLGWIWLPCLGMRIFGSLARGHQHAWMTRWQGPSAYEMIFLSSVLFMGLIWDPFEGTPLLTAPSTQINPDPKH